MSWNLEIISDHHACLAAIALEPGIPAHLKDFLGKSVDACAQVTDSWAADAKKQKSVGRYGIWVKTSGHVDAHTYVCSVEVRPIRVE